MTTDDKIETWKSFLYMSIEESPDEECRAAAIVIVKALHAARKEAFEQVRELLTAPCAWEERVKNATALIDAALADDTSAKEDK